VPATGGIGHLFNSPEVQFLLAQPAASDANLKLATLELEYWESKDNPLGKLFSPQERAQIQEMSSKVMAVVNSILSIFD